VLTSQVCADASAPMLLFAHTVNPMMKAASGVLTFGLGFTKWSVGYLSTPIPDGWCGKPTPDFTGSGGVGIAKPGSIFWPR
jgi:hypothetical protein